MIAKKLIYSMGRKNGITIIFAHKADMLKAYDRVEAHFLLQAFICLDSPGLH